MQEARELAGPYRGTIKVRGKLSRGGILPVTRNMSPV
jgi:hypothetical protein